MKVNTVGLGVDATIDGHSLTEFGAWVVDWKVPPLPNTRDNEINVAGQVGVYDAGTELGRLDVTMTIGFWTNAGRDDLRDKVRTFIALVDPRNGYLPVSFEEDNDHYLMLKLVNQGSGADISMNPSNADEVACTVSLQFKAADPHWYSNAHPTTTVAGITSAAPVVINNPGAAPTPVSVLVHAVAAVAGGFQVTLAGQIIGYGNALANGDQVLIDTDAWTITLNGANAIGAWSGALPWLPGGASNVSVNKANLQVSVTFTPRWVA